jgi:hypothetical protein
MSRAGRRSTNRRRFLESFDWQSLLKRDGDELATHYRHVLESLVKRTACSASGRAKRFEESFKA